MSTTNWIELGPADLVAPGANRTIAGVTVFNVDGRLTACETRCPHMGHPMSKGTVRDGVITCAWHRWEFDLASGGCYRGACDDLRVFPIKIENGRAYVDRSAAKIDAGGEGQRLQESMMDGDLYLQAKAIARLDAAGVGVREIAAIASAQAFEHSVGAHQTTQAAVELQAICDAHELAQLVDDEARVDVLLSGIRIANGPSGKRAHITALPPPHDPTHLRDMLSVYTLDSSPLGVERILLTVGSEFDGAVLALASSATFIHHREVLQSVFTALLHGVAGRGAVR
jgi:nitrite reductase/ring-hydroxylating ferredoxin subunit